MLAQSGWLPSQLIDAAPEWQAGSLGWRSRKLVVAFPLEGLVGKHLEQYRDLRGEYL